MNYKCEQLLALVVLHVCDMLRIIRIIPVNVCLKYFK